MKKILVFGITENPGGVESVIMSYYRSIDRNQIQFDFLCNTEEVAYEDEIKALGGTVYRIPARRDGRRIFYQALDRFMREHASEYHGIWVNVCSLANIDYLVYAKKYGISKRIIHCHNAENGDSFLRGMLHRLNRFRVKQVATDFWSCSDEASRWFFGSGFEKNKNYRYVTNAIDPYKFAANESVRSEYRRKLSVEDKFVVGHIGRFHFQKNHKFVLEVFRELKNIRPEAELLLIGQGDLMQETRQLAETMQIADSVQFLGVRSDIPQLYQAMDVFLFPSIFEGLPIVLLEAQANGLPCLISDRITSKIGVNRNLYRKRLDDSAKDWAASLVDAASEPGRIVPTDFYESPFNIEKQVKLLETLLSS